MTELVSLSKCPQRIILCAAVFIFSVAVILIWNGSFTLGILFVATGFILIIMSKIFTEYKIEGETP